MSDLHAIQELIASLQAEGVSAATIMMVVRQWSSGGEPQAELPATPAEEGMGIADGLGGYAVDMDAVADDLQGKSVLLADSRYFKLERRLGRKNR